MRKSLEQVSKFGFLISKWLWLRRIHTKASLTALNKSKWEKQVTEISESVYNSIQYV